MRCEYAAMDGFMYHTASEPTVYLREWLEKEWAKDAEEHPDQPWTPEWLAGVRTLAFTLEVVEMDAVKPCEELMAHEKDGYSFKKELEDRVAERVPAVRMGTSVMPLVIRGRDMQLMDGYTRYMVLKELGANRAFAYVGR